MSEEKKLPELTVEELSAAVDTAIENRDGDDAVEINIVAC